MTLYIILAIAFFLVYLERGRDAEGARRCVMCGSRYGEKHHKDCSWGK